MFKKNLKIQSLKKKKISNKIKKKILHLKMEDYNYDFKAQSIWFDKNIRDEDIHNLLFYENELIGYNCLRVFGSEKKLFYLFDTLLIKKRYRSFGFSSKIMNRSNQLIKKKNFFSILFCKKRMTQYYEKFGWKKLKNSSIKSSRIKELTCMKFNLRTKKSKIVL